MLVVSGVVGAGRQDRDRRRLLALRPDAPQVLQQHVGVVLHRPDGARGEELGEQAHHHPPVLEHVGHARGHAQVVLQHVVLAGAGPHQVDAGDVSIDAARNIHAGHLPPVLRVAQHPFRGNGTVLENFLVVIDVREEQIERAHTLLQSGFENPPLVRRNDPRDDVERNETLCSAIFAIHRERDSDAMECALRFVPFLCNAGAVGPIEPVGKGPVVRPDGTVRERHFVKREGGHAIVSGVSGELSKR